MSAHLQMQTLASHQLHADRLIVATHRGPVEYALTQDNELKPHRGAGGLVTALLETGNRMEVTWVAMAMTEGDRVALTEARQHGGQLPSPLRSQKMQLRYVAVPKSVYKKYYEQISNRILWFLQHSMHNPSAAAPARWLQDAWTNGYTVANQAIAEAVNREIECEAGSYGTSTEDWSVMISLVSRPSATPTTSSKAHGLCSKRQTLTLKRAPWPGKGA